MGWAKSALLGTVVVALAAPAAEAGCVWSDIVRDEARAATVQAGTARAYFVQDDVLTKGCPNASPACRARAYLVPGNTVLTGQTVGAYTCAGYTSAKGVTTIGWLPSADVALLPEAAQSPSDLAGSWIGPEQAVTIEPGDGGAMKVRGEATWGMGDRWRREHGSVHTGEIAWTARPEAGELAFTMGLDDETLPYAQGEPFDCRVRMRRRGSYLLVRDNGSCGGANVSFTGLYARKD
ncbi:hypothetical protein ACLBX9_12060 [Methylobacterium sp. A49B]